MMLTRIVFVALLATPAVAFQLSPAALTLRQSQPALSHHAGRSSFRTASLCMSEETEAKSDSTPVVAAEKEVETPAPAVEEEAKPVTGSQRFDLKSKVDKSGAGFNQFDPVLSATTFVSRRFGLVGGLAAVALLASTEGKEIVAALFAEGAKKGTGEVFKTESGVSYEDILVGPPQAASPEPGKLIGASVTVTIADQTFKKNVAFKFGSRPFQNVVCQGFEDGLIGMRVGGQRKMTIPVELGPSNIKLPPTVKLVYDVTLNEVFDNYL